MWLRDFLSEDFPRFRTTVYGYNSKLSGHAGGSLEQYAQRFLEDLKDVRATDEVAQLCRGIKKVYADIWLLL